MKFAKQLQSRPKHKRQKSELIREAFPKIRIVEIRGQLFYQVDARKTGTLGKQETFSDKGQAVKRAEEIAKDLQTSGTEGLAISAELRFMALKGTEILAPFGRTVLQACQFYRDFLEAEKAKRAGDTVAKLAEEWYQFKKSGARKELRKASLEDLRTVRDRLILFFGKMPIGAVTKADIKSNLDKMKIKGETKDGYRNRYGQFFNWCIEEGKGITVNPADKTLKYGSGKNGAKDVVIWTPQEVEQALRLCETEFPQLTAYIAISVFAGLRPEEAERLKWESIHLEEKVIMVLHETTKVSETRPVPIEDNLLAWLETIPEEKRKGLVIPEKNFGNLIREFRAKLGYRYLTKRWDKEAKAFKRLNPNGPRGEYVQDTTRHSYASYWLAKYQNRAQLAENMGNSVGEIKKRYKKVVTKAAQLAFWLILPLELFAEEDDKPRRNEKAKPLDEDAIREMAERDKARYRQDDGEDLEDEDPDTIEELHGISKKAMLLAAKQILRANRKRN